MSKVSSPTRDEEDQKIARCLIEDPTATNDDIVERSKGLSKSTVQRHRSQMEEEGVLSRGTQITDWTAVGFGLRFRIDILINQLELRQGGGPDGSFPDKLKTPDPINSQERLAIFIKERLVDYVAWRIETTQEKDDRHPNALALTAEQFKQSIVVQDVTILLGHHADLAVTVRARNIPAVRKFVTSGLRMMRGITTTSTANEVWSYMEVGL
jgi:DNA-binding Lrp family transcriptional regulator